VSHQFARGAIVFGSRRSPFPACDPPLLARCAGRRVPGPGSRAGGDGRRIATGSASNPVRSTGAAAAGAALSIRSRWP
jgi:hypothetical protein